MKKSKWRPVALKILGISLGGFVGFNLSFLIAALIIMTLGPKGGMGGSVLGQTTFMVVIYLLFFGVNILRIPTWIKATVFTMPTMSTLVMIGVVGYSLGTIVVLTIGALYVGCVAAYILYRKWDWTYRYALAYVTLMALYVILAGVEI